MRKTIDTLELVRKCPNCGNSTLAKGEFYPEAPAFGGDTITGWLCTDEDCGSFYFGDEPPEEARP